jgi:SAM-dependent methyltransferase
VGVAWEPYLTAFHASRPGVTEAVLSAARDADGDPYDWVARALPAGAPVVDVACGSGPLAERLGRRWVGVDRAAEEVALAARRVPGAVLRADATAVPLRDGSATAVACSLGLMLVHRLGAVLAEVRRLLPPEGRFVVLLPATAPVTLRDRLRYGRLLLALRVRRLPFPDPAVVDRPDRTLSAAGFTVMDDDRRRFARPVHTPQDADLFVRSLYVPGVPAGRTTAAAAVARRWVGTDIGLPLRRVVAVRR